MASTEVLTCWVYRDTLALCVDPLHACHAKFCRSVVERLSVPGVRRLFVIQPDSRTVWGILSLSDVAAFLFDVI